MKEEQKMKETTEIVISKEQALFRLDGQGFWRNEDGKFKNKKIIDYFHHAISRDENGYFVSQDKGGIIEKVYFPYDDTAIFVFDLTLEPEISLILNTGRIVRLEPDQLFIRNDSLYTQTPDERIKFSERALVKISEKLEESGHHLQIRIKDKLYPIPELP